MVQEMIEHKCIMMQYLAGLVQISTGADACVCKWMGLKSVGLIFTMLRARSGRQVLSSPIRTP